MQRCFKLLNLNRNIAGHRRLDGRVFDVCLQRPTGIRTGQLRHQIRRSSRKDQESDAGAMGEGQESRPWANGCSRCIRRTQFVCYGKTEWNAIHYSYFPNGFASKSTVGDWFATPVLILQMKTNSRWVTQMIAKKIAIKFGIKVIQTQRWEEEKKRKETRKEHLNIPNFIMAWWFQTSGRFPTWTFKGQKKNLLLFFFLLLSSFSSCFFSLRKCIVSTPYYCYIAAKSSLPKRPLVFQSERFQ